MGPYNIDQSYTLQPRFPCFNSPINRGPRTQVRGPLLIGELIQGKRGGRV